VQDTQARQSAGGLFGQHGRTVVGHQRAWQTALHKGLAQGMNQTLCALIKIPLQVAHQARAVIDHAQQHGGDPQAFAGEDLARAVMEIKVPQYAVHRILWRMQSPAICGVGSFGGAIHLVFPGEFRR